MSLFSKTQKAAPRSLRFAHLEGYTPEEIILFTRKKIIHNHEEQMEKVNAEKEAILAMKEVNKSIDKAINQLFAGLKK